MNFFIFDEYRDFRHDDLICLIIWKIESENMKDLSYPHKLNDYRIEILQIMINIKYKWNQYKKKRKRE